MVIFERSILIFSEQIDSNEKEEINEMLFAASLVNDSLIAHA
jgi:hypothetical protein